MNLPAGSDDEELWNYVWSVVEGGKQDFVVLEGEREEREGGKGRGKREREREGEGGRVREKRERESEGEEPPKLPKP